MARQLLTAPVESDYQREKREALEDYSRKQREARSHSAQAAKAAVFYDPFDTGVAYVCPDYSEAADIQPW